MAGRTPFYGWAFFDFNDDLGTPLNVQREKERFLVIDKQLYGLYSIFGNGVINGWNVVEGDGLSVTIEPGVGIISNLAVQSSFSVVLSSMPTNALLNIYAYLDAASSTTRDVSFTFSNGEISNGILLATVQTGGTGIEIIDNTVKETVGFKAIIDDEVATHRHDGVTALKIDLETETQGFLPMDRMADVDASKIKGGKLPSNVVPTLDHGDLKDIGRYSHAGLDVLAQSIQKNNLQLFGEITSVNLLKAIIAQKYDKADIDERFINELALIPGISPDTFIDFAHTTAAVDLDNNCISGLPAFENNDAEYGNPISFSELRVITASWTTDDDLSRATVLSNLSVNDGVQIASDTIYNRTIDNFDVAGAIPGSSVATFEPELVADNAVSVKYDSSAVDGQLGGLFTTTTTRHAIYRKRFDKTQDWADYNWLVLHVKNYGATHSAVFLALKDANNNDLAVYKILDEDEVTVFDNVLTDGYAKKEFDLSGVTRNAVKGYDVYTGTILNQTEAFYLDAIYLKSTGILYPQGTFRMRYSTTAPVIFNSVEYTADVPQGTQLRVRVRVADSQEHLLSAPYTSLLSSGQIFGLNGTNIEIDVTFVSDDNRALTPVLSDLYLTMLVPSTESGLVISSIEDWYKGELDNVTVNADASVELTNKNVDNMYFTTGNIINELNTDLIPVVGINGGNLPISPSQGFQGIRDQTEIRGLTNPRSAIRLISGNYLVCDTDNDRIMEIKPDGTFVRGFGSHNHDYATSAYAVCACYNPRLGTLFIPFTKDVDITNYDLTNITLAYDSFKHYIVLDNQLDKVRTLRGDIVARNVVPGASTAGTTGLTEKVLCVVLDIEKQKALENLLTPLYVEITNNVNILPMEVFYGDFMYFGVQGVFRPIHAFQANEKEWLFCNSVISKTYDKQSTSMPVIQFDLRIGELFEGQIVGATFVYDGVYFSDIVLGSVYDLGNDKLLIAGLSKLPSATTTDTTTPTTAPTDAEKLAAFVGTVIVLEKNSKLVAFRYQSPEGMYPSDCTVDDDGYYTICESSMLPQNGRIIKLDPYGNIIWISEGGMFTVVNDARKINNNHLFVST